jgi:hypothetical protein
MTLKECDGMFPAHTYAYNDTMWWQVSNTAVFFVALFYSNRKLLRYAHAYAYMHFYMPAYMHIATCMPLPIYKFENERHTTLN